MTGEPSEPGAARASGAGRWRRSWVGCALLGLLLAVLAGGGALLVKYPTWLARDRPPPRIGYLAFGVLGSPPMERLRDEFRAGLAENGFFEDENVTLEYRFADGSLDRLEELAAELVAEPVDLILAADSQVVPVASAATSTIPIVMALYSDPVAAGFADSLARPGHNLSGLSNLNRPLAAKRLELVRELIPTASRVAVLWNDGPFGVRLQYEEMERAAEQLGLTLISLPVRAPTDFDAAFETAAREGAQSVVILPEPLTLAGSDRLVALARQYALPDVHGASDKVESGALISLAADRFSLMRRAGYYAARVLRGYPIGQLPIEQATRFEIAVNLPVAQALGVRLPSSLWEEVRIVR